MYIETLREIISAGLTSEIIKNDDPVVIIRKQIQIKSFWKFCDTK